MIKDAWLRNGRDSWQQYVGRRVQRVRPKVAGRRDPYFVAWVGREFRGFHQTLDAAFAEAERV